MDDGLLLAVRDDGIGFDPAAPRAGRSLGLASMRERMQLVNGTLDVESAPGQGTAVVAWVPGAPDRAEPAREPADPQPPRRFRARASGFP